MNQQTPRLDGVAIAQPTIQVASPAPDQGYVGVHLRTVPAGVETIDGVQYMRATLLISPGPLAGAPSASRACMNVRLADWPQVIEREILGDLPTEDRAEIRAKIALQPANPPLAVCPEVPDAHKWLVPLRAMKLNPQQRQRDLTTIGELWKSLLGSDSTFAALARELAPPGKRESEAGKLLERLDPAAKEPVAGAPASVGAPDVVNAARNVLGVMLPLERARTLRDRLEQLSRSASIRPAEVNLAYAAFNPYALDEPWPSFLGEPPHLRQLAQAAGGVQTDGDPVLFSRTHKDAVHSNERTAARIVADAVGEDDVAKGLKRLQEQRRLASMLPATTRGTDGKRAASSELNRELDRHVLSTTRSGEDIACRVQTVDRDGKPATSEGACDVAARDPMRADSEGHKYRQLFAAIQTQPMLARLFNLACDVLIRWDDALNRKVDDLPAFGAARYGLMSAGLRKEESRIWILTKFHSSGTGDAWPCTTDEALIRLSSVGTFVPSDLSDGSAEQVDGFLPLAARSGTAQSATYRYEIVTIDVERAAEQRIAAEAARFAGSQDPTYDPDARAVTKLDEKDQNLLLTLRTAGFAIADRQRAIDVTRAIRRSASRTSGGCIIGAEDLTVGYRLDVSAPTSGPGRISSWHPLCNRTIRFGEPGLAGAFGQTVIERILASLEPDPLRRARLDAVTIAPATRLDSANGTDAAVTAHVEDQIACWLGLPLGVDTDVNPGYELVGAAWNSAIPLVPDKGALPLSQTFGLAPPPNWPPSEPWRPLPLRFGARYFFRMRAVLVGGGVRPVNHVSREFQPLLPIPSIETGGFRFRRHERIERPLVSTPQAFLRKAFDSLTDGVRETGSSAIVRSMVGRNATDSRVSTRTVRLFSPPPVAPEFAELHVNAFPNDPSIVEYRKVQESVEITRADTGQKVAVTAVRWHGPRDGMRDVAYSHPAGGFPVYSFERRMDGELDTSGRSDHPWMKRVGDAVCIPTANDGVRAVPYYPDPAAEFIVFGLSDASGQFTEDPPVVVRLREANAPATSCRPVAVEIIAGQRDAMDPKRTPTRLWAGGGHVPPERAPTRARTEGGQVPPPESKPSVSPSLQAAAFLDANGAITSRKPAGSATEVSRITVRLAPGEQFKLEAWCIPSAEMLGKLFEVINGIAMLGASQNAGVCPVGGTAASSDGTGTACSPAHLPADAASVRDRAAQCFDKLCKMPLPEIVATARIELTHALDKPFSPPEHDIRLVRLSATQFDKALRERTADEKKPADADTDQPSEASQMELPAFFGEDSDGNRLKVVPGSKELLIGGMITVDRAVTGFFEVEGTGPCLISGGFDNVSRKRTKSEVVRGIWPVDPAFVNADTGKAVGKTIQSIYGFDVDKDDRVSHRLEKATLLRIDDAPLLGANRRVSIRSDSLKQDVDLLQSPRRNLRHIQRIAAKAKATPSPLLPRANRPSEIPDTLARVVQVDVVAGSRTSSFFRSSDTGAVLEGGDATMRSALSHVIAIPSTAAPAAVVPLSIVPSFNLVSTASYEGARPGRSGTNGLKVVVERHTRLRIRLQRPWFSSGFGERLGLILWPPDILLAGGSRVKDGDVLRDYDLEWYAADKMRNMALRALDDHKMPPEWAYATRWGLDPIRQRERLHPWLVPPDALSAFADGETRWHDSINPPSDRIWNVLGKFERKAGDPSTSVLELDRDVVYVGRAQVPFPESAAADNTPTNARAPGEIGTYRKSRSFAAALLTFLPRFDVDQECWYCDLDIDPKGASYPFVRLGLVRYQPLAPAELQVSLPVVEWAQIPPSRTAALSRSTHDQRAVVLEVRGLGARLARQAAPESVFTWIEEPALKVTLCWRYADGREEIAQLGEWKPRHANDARPADLHSQHEHYSANAAFDFIPRSQAEWEEYLEFGRAGPQPIDAIRPMKKRAALRCVDTPALRASGEVVWKATFMLDREPQSGPEQPWLVAHVEEVEAMLPASYPDEPYNEFDPDLTKERRIEVSGPKFAAIIEFRGPRANAVR